jgi:hypothetical protein
MIGNDHVGPGVMVLTMRDIFDAMQTRSDDTKFDVVCSYLEVCKMKFVVFSVIWKLISV